MSEDVPPKIENNEVNISSAESVNSIENSKNKSKKSIKTSFVDSEGLMDKEQAVKHINSQVVEVEGKEMVVESPTVTFMKLLVTMNESLKLSNESYKLTVKAYEKLAQETELLRKSVDNQTAFFNELAKPSSGFQSKPMVQSTKSHVAQSTLNSDNSTVSSASSNPAINAKVEGIKEGLGELADKLIFDVDSSSNTIHVKPDGWLNQDFFTINDYLKKSHEAIYVSAGKNTHWEISKL